MSILKKKNNIKIKYIDDTFLKNLTNTNPNFKNIDETLNLDEGISYYITKQTEILWTVDEIHYDTKDIEEFIKIPNDYQDLIKSIILYFLFADKLVISNLEEMKSHIPYLSSNYFYILQMYVESIHDRIYEKSARLYYNNDEKFIKDKQLLEQMIMTAEAFNYEEFNIENYISLHYESLSKTEKKIFKAVCIKLNLVNKWRNLKSFLHKLIAFFTIESVSFNCLFLIINIFKSYNKGLKYLIDINEFVSRDEHIHALYGIHIYKNYILNKLPKEEVIYIVKSITDVEIEFLTLILDEDFTLNKFTREDFINYLKNTSNIILQTIDIEEIYEITKNIPSEFELQGAKIKTNFFERTALYNANIKKIETDSILDLY